MWNAKKMFFLTRKSKELRNCPILSNLKRSFVNWNYSKLLQRVSKQNTKEKIHTDININK